MLGESLGAVVIQIVVRGDRKELLEALFCGCILLEMGKSDGVTVEVVGLVMFDCQSGAVLGVSLLNELLVGIVDSIDKACVGVEGVCPGLVHRRGDIGGKEGSFFTRALVIPDFEGCLVGLRFTGDAVASVLLVGFTEAV